MEITVPEPGDVLAGMGSVQATLGGEQRGIAEWRAAYEENLPAARQRPDIAIFNTFVNSLLERAMSGEAWTRRRQAIQQVFLSLEDVTEDSAQNVLAEARYRFPRDGTSVILEAKRIVTEAGFTWPGYVERAEQNYEGDFREDLFLKVRGVSYKTRDLALSELSDRFVAIDLHVVRVTSRTGLLLHGYGDPRITTDLSRAHGYLFFHDLMLKLARLTGWPGTGYSPGEIDRMFWHFGRAICGATPDCRNCPLAGVCLTSVGRAAGDL